MNDENSVTAGTKFRSTLRKSETNVHNRRAVIRIVPIKASNAAFLRVMVRSMNGASVGRQLRFLRLGGTRWPYGLMKKYKRWGAGDGALDSFGILRTPETPALESY